MNALATRFLRRHYVILFSDIINTLETNSGGLSFYIGHELGHIKRRHIARAFFLSPAYARAREDLDLKNFARQSKDDRWLLDILRIHV